MHRGYLPLRASLASPLQAIKSTGIARLCPLELSPLFRGTRAQARLDRLE